MSKAKRPLAIGVLTVLFFAFQNCGQVKFDSQGDETVASSLKAGQLIIENGRTATNRKVLNVRFEGINKEYVAEMRLALAMDPSNPSVPDGTPWIPYVQETTFDLESAFASDGTKDVQKHVVAELRPTFNDPGLKILLTNHILLDTVPPKVDLDGFLRRGLQGEAFTLNQDVKLEWAASDVSAPTGNQSGLDHDGAAQVGWSGQEDCSRIPVTQLSLRQRDSLSARKISWPSADTLSPLFICVFIEDVAGNRVTGLSQPLTQIWKVIAGDNNQGNGGSWKAANVRFGIPKSLAMDSFRNIYILDSAYNTIRKVTADGQISTYLGTIDPASSFPKLPDASGNLHMDSQDRLYFGSNSGVWRIDTKNPSAQPVRVIKGYTLSKVRKLKDGQEYMLLTESTGTYAAGNLSYGIYKVPFSFLEGKVDVTLADLAAFKVIGGPVATTRPTPREQSGSYSMPILNEIDATDDGDIIFSGQMDGVGYGIGESAIYRIRGQVMTRLAFTTSVQMTIVNENGKTILYSARFGSGRLERMDLTALPDKIEADLNVQTLAGLDASKSAFYGVVVDRSSLNSPNPILYVADYVRAKIVKYQGGAVGDTFGRDTYDPSLTKGLDTIVNAPLGLTEDANGNVYFFEGMNHIVRKLDAAGNISLFAGKPLEPGSPSLNDGKLRTASVFQGSGGVVNGYAFVLRFDEANQRLLFGLGNYGLIQSLPLDVSKPVETMKFNNFPATTLAGVTTVGPLDKNKWAVADLDFLPDSLGGGLLVSRMNPYSPFRTQIVHYDLNFSAQTGTPFLGSELETRSLAVPAGLSTSMLTGPSSAVALTPNQKFTVLDSSVYYAYDKIYRAFEGNVTTVSSAGSNKIAALKDASGRIYFFGFGTLGPVVSYFDEVAKTQRYYQLCFPGSSLNAREFVLSRDKKKLLISDTNFQRVVQYNLVSGDQLRLFSRKADGSCQPI